MSTVFVKSSDGASSRWAQFNPGFVAALHANGLSVCAWQFVYGNDPAGEAALGADAVADGRRLPRDRRRVRSTRASTPPAQQYMAALRAAVGPDYPIGADLASPTSTTTRGCPTPSSSAPAARRPTCRRSTGRTSAGPSTPSAATRSPHNRIYGAPIAPLGQTYDNPPAGGHRALPLALGRLRRAGLSLVVLAGDTARPTWLALAQPVQPARHPRPTRAGRR